MNRFFHSIHTYCNDCYVADYSEQTKNQRGVELSEEPFDDIAYFHLQNDPHIKYQCVNFEENPEFFRKESDPRKRLSQCECMFVSSEDVPTQWVCLLEMKYCNEKNIGKRSNKAYRQLENTLDVLKDKGVIDSEKYRVYFNISIPDHSNKEPFDAFHFSPADKLELLRTKKIHLLGYNSLLVLDGTNLKAPHN